MKRYLAVAATLVLAMLVPMFVSAQEYDVESCDVEYLQQSLRDASSRLETCQRELNHMFIAHSLAEKRATDRMLHHPIGLHLEQMLLGRGLEDPVEDLIADLVRHPELIPFNKNRSALQHRVLPERVRVLSSSWLYAEFDNGHEVGAMLVEFEVVDSAISWRLIDARME